MGNDGIRLELDVDWMGIGLRLVGIASGFGYKDVSY